MSDSLYRGARAAAESGGFRTEVLQDRMTRASCFICRSAEEAAALAPLDRGRAAEDARLAGGARRRVDLELREAARGRDARRRARCATSCGPSRPATRVGREHDDPQRVRAEHGLRHGERAREAGARDARGEHGRRQEGLAPLLRARRPRQDGDRRVHAHRGGDPAGAAHDDRRPARALLGGHARRRRVGHAVGRVHARDRDRRHLRRDRPGPGHGRARARWPTAPAGASRAGSTARSGCPASRSAPSAAARLSPTPAPGSR